MSNINSTHSTPPNYQHNYLSIPVETTTPSKLRRDSVLFNDFGSFKGVNSLGRFATSYNRAQSFKHIDPLINRSRSFFSTSPHTNDINSSSANHDQDDDMDAIYDPDTLGYSIRGNRVSNAIHDFLTYNDSDDNMDYSTFNDNAIDDEHSMIASYNPHKNYRQDSIFSFQNQRLIHNISRQSGQSESASIQPLILKQVEDPSDGKLVTIIAGQSTAPQTIFNSINVLIGVGLLALSVGIYKAGWIIGVLLLLMCGVTCYWSATLLSKCMDTNPTLMTYADLGYVAYGPQARLLISILFSIDLLGSGVSLIVLFSDSLNALIPQISTLQFKLLAFIILTPFTFLPLSILSIISLLGIVSTFSIILTIFIAGVTKQVSPGSLLSPMPTNLYPNSTKDLLIAIGILMAPFGGHGIFPSLKADMRHPKKFTKTLRTTFTISVIADLSMGVIGFLMFGNLVNNEITNNVLLTPGYPKFVYGGISFLIALVPLAKTPLNARPIITTLEIMLGVENNNLGPKFKVIKNWNYYYNLIMRNFLKLFVNLTFVLIAIAFPEFDRIISILGSSICYLICLILPCCFYLKICHGSIRAGERSLCYVVIIVASILAILGTYAALFF